MRPPTLSFAIVTVCTMFVMSCGDSSSTTLNRRIKDEENAWRMHPALEGTEPGKALQRRVLSILQIADAESLKHPQLALVLIIRKEHAYHLMVYWVESTPTVDSISLNVQSEIEALRFLEDRLRRLKWLSEEGDLCLYIIEEFPRDSALGELIASAEGSSELQISLQQGNRILASSTQVFWIDSDL